MCWCDPTELAMLVQLYSNIGSRYPMFYMMFLLPFNPFSAEKEFKRQNMTFVDVRMTSKFDPPPKE